jgi:predicted lipoprotein with Yx(FWY)xxD motif
MKVARISLTVLALSAVAGGLPTTAVALAGSAHAASSSTINVRSTAYGKILVNSKGVTVYYFAIDKKNKSNCNAACLSTWPLVTVTGKPTAGPGVSKKLLGTIKVGGKKEVTYNGLPLYTYVADGNNPGQTNGEDTNANGGLWWVVSPAGAPIKKKP